MTRRRDQRTRDGELDSVLSRWAGARRKVLQGMLGSTDTSSFADHFAGTDRPSALNAAIVLRPHIPSNTRRYPLPYTPPRGPLPLADIDLVGVGVLHDPPATHHSPRTPRLQLRHNIPAASSPGPVIVVCRVLCVSTPPSTTSSKFPSLSPEECAAGVAESEVRVGQVDLAVFASLSGATRAEERVGVWRPGRGKGQRQLLGRACGCGDDRAGAQAPMGLRRRWRCGA